MLIFSSLVPERVNSDKPLSYLTERQSVKNLLLKFSDDIFYLSEFIIKKEVYL